MKIHYLAALALMVAMPAQALVITPLVVVAEATAETPGGANSDNQLTTGTASVNESSSYTVTDSSGFSVTDTVFATALQRDDGFSYIELRVETNGQRGFASTGKLSGYGAEASTFFALEYFNNGSTPVSPIFNFSLSNIAAETATAGGPAVEAELTFDAYVNGGGDSYSASATARATYNNPQIVNQNNMSGSVVPYNCVPGFCFNAAYIFNDISDAILVGVLNPGQRKEVIVEMSAELTFIGIEQGAYARIRDPNGGPVLTYSTTFANVPGGPGPGPSPVPAPATWLLMLGGLYAATRRRGAPGKS